MKELTVIILAKNEEDVIGDAIISSKKLTKDILVVDANSSDNTVEIAISLGAKVIKHPFSDFSDQRNFAILNANTQWVLYLDADERLSERFVGEVESVLSNYKMGERITGFYIYRQTYYFGQDWKFKDKVQRLFLRSAFVEWYGTVHESPKIRGEFGEIKAPIVHYTHRNLSQMLAKTNEWSKYEAKLRFDSHHPNLAPWRFLRVMCTEFLNSYIKNKGYKNGTYGLIEGLYQSFSIFITYAKLWEMQEARRRKS